MVQKDEMAPALTVSDQTGAVRTVAVLSGPRGLVLVFYRGYW